MSPTSESSMSGVNNRFRKRGYEAFVNGLSKSSHGYLADCNISEFEAGWEQAKHDARRKQAEAEKAIANAKSNVEDCGEAEVFVLRSIHEPDVYLKSPGKGVTRNPLEANKVYDLDHAERIYGFTMGMWELVPVRSLYVPKSSAPVTIENPKDAVGSAKTPMSCVSAAVLAELGIGMMEGSLKYGRHNYRVARIRTSVYYDAAMRHLMAWWEGEDIDPDSGMSHITKAMATLAVLRDCQITGQVKDDRPPPLPEKWLSELNSRAAELVAKYPEPKSPVTKQSVDEVTTKS